ncbi:protein RETARDED ROOT GROWTH, mitochondrial-like isoform X1 [Zingiber officinale]|uniref:protein RETARDED ROOT GROWTH, mitochondrial-like isoform X1 n=1 Tax=Zingiber officinale TaxID=94328 RepID=UPI001C4CB944|nr:protein RETARDED ROOT GROWTH, mitochondrial-like isoform X1 [Zingiber officinale]
MAIWEFAAFARRLRTLLSYSASPPPPFPYFPPPYGVLRRGSSQIPFAFLLPGRGLSAAASFLLVQPRSPTFLFLSTVSTYVGDPFSRHYSSTPPDREVESREDQQAPIPCTVHDEEQGNRLSQAQQEKKSRFIPVKAYFLCTSIDLRSLQAQNAFNVVSPPTSRATNYIVFRYYDVKDDPQVMVSGLQSEASCHYMVVFHYGSVVLFNVSDHEVDGYLKIVEKHASGLLPEMRKDDFAIVEKPTLENWMQGGLDYIVLKTLNMDGIRIIGRVLSQSIALDHYIHQVDGMVAEFAEINRSLEKTGISTMKRKQLFQLVWKSNSNLTAVILKLGLFESSDIAWRNANYAQVWEYLRDEYELSQRFENLNFKLKFVEHNISIIQEILQNRTFVLLEWLIIFLIAVDIVLSYLLH